MYVDTDFVTAHCRQCIPVHALEGCSSAVMQGPQHYVHYTEARPNHRHDGVPNLQPSYIWPPSDALAAYSPHILVVSKRSRIRVIGLAVTQNVRIAFLRN